MKQSVNLRAPSLTGYGDDATREAAERELDKARDAMTVPYAVAPGAPLRLSKDVVLEPGATVKAEHFVQAGFDRPRAELERLIRQGRILDRSHGRAG